MIFVPRSFYRHLEEQLCCHVLRVSSHIMIYQGGFKPEKHGKLENSGNLENCQNLRENSVKFEFL